jgi:hypothetical protein
MSLKDKIIAFVVIGSLLIMLYFAKKHDNVIPRISIVGKIYDYDTSINLDCYYRYKFKYNNKIYKNILNIDEIDYSKIDKCYEIFIDPKNANDSKLNLDKELDCELYKQSLQTSEF